MPDIEDELAKAAVNNITKSFDVSQWGGSSSVNCYAWAVNCKTPSDSKPLPGQATNYGDVKDANGYYDPIRCIKGAESDGLIERPCRTQTDPPSPRDGYYLVALYLCNQAEMRDHHWYRKDPKYGRWTHKPGAGPIKNFGPDNKVLPTELIMAPHFCLLPKYPYKFVSYFEVPNGGIAI